MRYFSLFSGIGGFELGFPKTWECIGFSETDKWAIKIYLKHFPKHKNYGDVKAINPDELPDFDLLCGGFPCQSFSMAGKRRGFEDIRGTLFFEIARVAGAKRPRYLFLENVKGLLSNDNGNTFATILKTLSELGYDLQWECLNSKNFGVPQNRERVFIIGNLRGTPRSQIFPLGQDGGISEAPCHEPLPTLTANDWKGPSKQRAGIVILDNKQQHGLSDESMFALRRAVNRGVMDGARLRKLTPLECERLQGFLGGWTEGISDTQRYKCLGNAVTVNVIRAISEKFT